MIIVSSRKFRDNQNTYFEKAAKEEVILQTLRYGSFRLVPIREDEDAFKDVKKESEKKKARLVSNFHKGEAASAPERTPEAPAPAVAPIAKEDIAEMLRAAVQEAVAAAVPAATAAALQAREDLKPVRPLRRPSRSRVKEEVEVAEDSGLPVAAETEAAEKVEVAAAAPDAAAKPVAAEKQEVSVMHDAAEKPAAAAEPEEEEVAILKLVPAPLVEEKNEVAEEPVKDDMVSQELSDEPAMADLFGEQPQPKAAAPAASPAPARPAAPAPVAAPVPTASAPAPARPAPAPTPARPTPAPAVHVAVKKPIVIDDEPDDHEPIPEPSEEVRRHIRPTTAASPDVKPNFIDPSLLDDDDDSYIVGEEKPDLESQLEMYRKSQKKGFFQKLFGK